MGEGTVNRPSTYGKADHDVGGDHAWPDESGKYLWVSTFRVSNPGVHMLSNWRADLLRTWHGFPCAEELCVLCGYPWHWKPRQSRRQPCCWNFSVHAYKSLCTHSVHQDDSKDVGSQRYYVHH